MRWVHARYCARQESGHASQLEVAQAEVELANAQSDLTDATRARGLPTLPSTIGLEKKTNPFLRPSSPEIRRSLGLEAAKDVDVFAETRRRKDVF